MARPPVRLPVQPPAIVRQAEQKTDEVITPEFLAYIKDAENPNHVGWDKNKKLWFPHRDPSGGFDIGFGHKLQTKEEYRHYKRGLSNEEVEKLLVHDLMLARRKVKQYIQKKYKVDLQISPKQEQMLVDYVFNIGGLTQFPRMVDAVLRSDKERMRKEYKRFAKIGGKMKELTNRNQKFSANFFSESRMCG